MISIDIRPANKLDIDTLVAFNAALARETEGKILSEITLREGILALLDTPSLGGYIVAEITHDGTPSSVGQLMVTYEWSDWRNGMIWWLQSVYVDPAWRRKGVYRAMHHYIVEEAKRAPNNCGLRLYVEQHNETAQAVYHTVGLVPAGYLVYEDMFQGNPRYQDRNMRDQEKSRENL